jgi:flagellin
MGAQRSLSAVSRDLSRSFRRLASGSRIAIAADDAAGLGISNSMRARIRSWGAAERNIRDGLSIAQTTEGGLSEVSGILSRMRELFVQGASGTLQAQDQAALDDEVQALKAELDRLSEDTDFNGLKILSGMPQRIGISVSGVSVQGIQVHFINSSSAGLGIDNAGIPSVGPDPLVALDGAIQQVAAGRGQLGVDQSRLQSALATAQITSGSLSAAESRIRDVDVAHETAQLTRATIMQQMTVAVLAQANSQPELALGLIRG